MDLGSAVLSAETALDLLDDEGAGGRAAVRGPRSSRARWRPRRRPGRGARSPRWRPRPATAWRARVRPPRRGPEAPGGGGGRGADDAGAWEGGARGGGRRRARSARPPGRGRRRGPPPPPRPRSGVRNLTTGAGPAPARSMTALGALGARSRATGSASRAARPGRRARAAGRAVAEADRRQQSGRRAARRGAAAAPRGRGGDRLRGTPSAASRRRPGRATGRRGGSAGRTGRPRGRARGRPGGGAGGPRHGPLRGWAATSRGCGGAAERAGRGGGADLRRAPAAARRRRAARARAGGDRRWRERRRRLGRRGGADGGGLPRRSTTRTCASAPPTWRTSGAACWRGSPAPRRRPAAAPAAASLVARPAPSDAAALDPDVVTGLAVAHGGGRPPTPRSSRARSGSPPSSGSATPCWRSPRARRWWSTATPAGRGRPAGGRRWPPRESARERAAVAPRRARERAPRAGGTRDGARIEVAANIGSAGRGAGPSRGADGVGLLRTEFLFLYRDTAARRGRAGRRYGRCRGDRPAGRYPAHPRRRR